jgi:phosphoserine phosphatase
MTKIPEPLEEQIKKIEQHIDQKRIKVKRKIAVFDLDNTLLIGDIGEAVFAALKNKEKNEPLTIQNKPIPFSWTEYQNLLNRNKKKKAYKKMVTAMSGIPPKTLIDTTRDVLNSKKNSIQLEDEQIPIPVPNKIMQTLVSFLKSLEYEMFIISASNHFSVQTVAREFFSFPDSNVFGIKPQLKYHQNVNSRDHTQILTSRLEKPVPVGRGKAQVYHKCIDSIPPLITAGDSETDINMLNLTHKNGLSIWVGDNQTRFLVMKQRIGHPQNSFYLERFIKNKQ